MKYAIYLLALVLACEAPVNRGSDTLSGEKMPGQNALPAPSPDSNFRSIHVLVALCDNRYQGIVPVSAKVGNGQDLDNNLYWGWGYGVRTYFKKSPEWRFIRKLPSSHPLLERLLFRHVSSPVYLVADAYDGRNMRECINDLLNGLAGKKKETILDDSIRIGLYGHARLLAFIGHDGLMDFSLPDTFQNTDSIKRDCILLACYSKKYFGPYIRSARANPVIWTTGLMGPEAYTLHDALTGYIKKESPGQIQTRAARAYAKYTKCSESAAKRLLTYDE